MNHNERDALFEELNFWATARKMAEDLNDQAGVIKRKFDEIDTSKIEDPFLRQAIELSKYPHHVEGVYNNLIDFSEKIRRLEGSEPFITSRWCTNHVIGGGINFVQQGTLANPSFDIGELALRGIRPDESEFFYGPEILRIGQVERVDRRRSVFKGDGDESYIPMDIFFKPTDCNDYAIMYIGREDIERKLKDISRFIAIGRSPLVKVFREDESSQDYSNAEEIEQVLKEYVLGIPAR